MQIERVIRIMAEEFTRMWLLTTTTALFTILYMVCKKPIRKHKKLDDIGSTSTSCENWRYDQLKKLVHENSVRLPAIFVDLEVFDRNTKQLVDLVRNSGKSLRIATKSIRCHYLIKRIQNLGRDVVSGFMCYSAEEAAFLADEGLDDFYIAYPTLQRCDVSLTFDLMKRGKTVTLTIDSVDHVTYLDKISRELQNQCDNELPRIGVCIDLDLSYKMLWGFIKLGAHRSQIDSISNFGTVVEAVQRSNHMKLVGVMGYEAHVAGLPDANPFAPFPNILIRFLKNIFFHNALKFRAEVDQYCKKEGISLEFFNGGGSGNIHDACADSVLTEVAAGSAFLQAQLFDYYVDNQCSPAVTFALQATRINNNYIVCQSGGFVASGPISSDKLPKPFNNPLKLKHYNDEGYGEVQTPLKISGLDGTMGETIQLADPVFFRPAKSGEIGEHFLEYHLLQNYEIVGKVKTYRGRGFVFH